MKSEEWKDLLSAIFHFSFFIIHLLDPIEKALLKQRLIYLPAAQNGYIEKQKKALTN